MIRADDDLDDDDVDAYDDQGGDLATALRGCELLRAKVRELPRRLVALEQGDRAGQRRRSGNPSTNVLLLMGFSPGSFRGPPGHGVDGEPDFSTPTWG